MTTWQLIIIGAYTLALLVVLPRLMAFRDLPTAFVFLAIWGRYLLAGLHQHTYPPLVAGLSPVALFTLFVAVGGMLLIPPRLYFRPYLVVFWVVIFVIAFSGLVNGLRSGDFMGMVDVLMGWVYFLVVALLLFRAMSSFGAQPVLRALLIILVTPLALQFLGVAMGVGGMDPTSGRYAYIAGYFHGGLFSAMLMTCLFVAILIRWRWEWIPLAFALLCTIGIYLGGYRTTVLASLPVVTMYLFATSIQGVAPWVRPLILYIIVVGGALVAGVLWANLPDEFADLTQVVESWRAFIKPPELYTDFDRSLFSGRAYLWSSYIYTWINGDLLNYLIGFGPNSHDAAFGKHPHNDLIKYLYEYGIMGVIIFFAIYASQTWMVLRVADPFMVLRLLGCLAGHFVINMATGGLSGIEALTLLAVLSATIWAYAETHVEAAPSMAPVSAEPKLLAARWRSQAAADALARFR